MRSLLKATLRPQRQIRTRRSPLDCTPSYTTSGGETVWKCHVWGTNGDHTSDMGMGYVARQGSSCLRPNTEEPALCEQLKAPLVPSVVLRRGGEEGRPRYQTSHPPAYPIYHARVHPVRCQRRSARGIRSLLKPALRPQRQIHTRRFPLDLAATTALNDPPGRARPGQVSCRTLAFSWGKTRSHAHGRFAQEKVGVRHETRTGYYAAFVRANGGT